MNSGRAMCRRVGGIMGEREMKEGGEESKQNVLKYVRKDKFDP